MLLGRTLDIEAVSRELSQGGLVTVVGPGGVGKTTLARHVMHLTSNLDRQPKFVDLTGASPSGLLGSIVGSIGYGSLEQLVEDMGNLRWLVVLDNCEHLLDSVAVVTEALLQRCPRLSILATSREPIEVGRETVVRLAPLSLEGEPSPAAQLFFDRSRTALSRAEDLKMVEQICGLVDGLPLAIELAAAKTGSMTLGEIIEGLQRPIDLLSNTRSRGPARHSSMHSAVAWSYDLLNEDERTALSELAVIEGAFSLAMAEAAVGARTRQILDDLVSRSLLVHEPEGEESWYRILETIRAFALEMGEDPEQAQRAWERVAGQTLDDLEKLPMAPERIPSLVKRGFPTVRRALEWHMEQAKSPVRLFGLTGHLWWLEDIGHQAEGAEILKRALDRWPEPNSDSAIAYGVLAGFQRFAGDLEGALRSARIAIQASDGVGAAFGHRVLGQADRRAGDWDAALEHFRLGTEAAKAGGAEGFATEIEIHAAMTLARSGDIAASNELIAGITDRAKPYPVLRAWARLFQSWIAFADDRARSREIAEEVLRESRSDSADPWVTAVAHQHLGIADLLDGDVEAGKDHLRLSLLGFLDIANRSDIALTLLAVAAMLNRDGNRDAARGVLASALAWGTRAMLGGFEETMYDEIGPLPDEPADEPMPSHAILALLGPSDDNVARPVANRFVRVGDLWEISFAGRDAVLPYSKGMADLARLISFPGSEIAALDLMGSALSSGSAGEASDETARSEYRARLAELQRDIDDAESANDPYRAESARAEMDELIDHLGSVFGIGGKPRPEKDAAERARSAVTARIRATIKKIGEVHEPLADHLDLSVSTGRFCKYAPAEPPEWEV